MLLLWIVFGAVGEHDYAREPGEEDGETVQDRLETGLCAVGIDCKGEEDDGTGDERRH